MKIRELRRLPPSSLRILCIEQNWYTRGTNAEYDHLLTDLTHGGWGHMSTEDIHAVAMDIMEHSNLAPGEDVYSVMWAVNQRCVVTFRPDDA